MNHHELTAVQIQAVDQAVQAAFPNAHWQPLDSLGGGLSTSALRKIAIDGQPYVVRFSNPADPHHNLAYEFDAMQVAARQKLAPFLHYANVETGVALMDFVEKQPLFANRESASTFLVSLAHLVRSLHQGEKFQSETPLMHKVELLFSLMRPDLLAVDLVQDSMALMRRLATALHDPADIRPCHCDINPGNILNDGQKLWLVDWSTATQENFYFDLAGCCTFFFYQSQQAEEAFLHAYFQCPLTEQEMTKYSQMRTFVSIYYGLIFTFLGTPLETALIATDEIDQLPDYPQFMSRVIQGKEQLEEPRSRQRFGFVFLKAAQVDESLNR